LSVINIIYVTSVRIFLGEVEEDTLFCLSKQLMLEYVY